MLRLMLKLYILFNIYFACVIVSMGVAAINDAVDADNHEALSVNLALPGVGIQNVRQDSAHSYLEELQNLKVGLYTYILD